MKGLLKLAFLTGLGTVAWRGWKEWQAGRNAYDHRGTGFSSGPVRDAGPANSISTRAIGTWWTSRWMKASPPATRRAIIAGCIEAQLRRGAAALFGPPISIRPFANPLRQACPASIEAAAGPTPGPTGE